MIRRVLDARFVRFILVGILSAAVDTGIVWVLVPLMPHYELAVSIGFIGGLLLNYVFHARFTFGASTFHARQFLRFLVVVAFNYGLTLGTVVVAHELFSFAVISGKILSLPLVALSGYTISRLWVFRDAPT